MDLDRAFELLRENSVEVPKPARLPSEEELTSFEKQLGVEFHTDYRRFQLEVSNLVAGILEPARALSDAQPYINLRKIANDAWEAGVPRDALAFCLTNGNYFLINQEGNIGYWDHDDDSAAFGKGTLAGWIVDEWLELDESAV